jgi:hypothetical protein
MRTHGAWYNTSQKLNSNHAGYMCSDQMLVAGKHYVLYLWSNSRDELQPDRRIDFIAGEGMTDLGVVTLPGYSD